MTDVARPTPRALLSGAVLAVLLCGVNSYLTLSFGVIEEGPTIAALFFFAFFFLSKRAITSSEMVLVATMGSAGGSLGFISNFFAARAMTGSPMDWWAMASFAAITSLLGLFFVVPLRELLILREDLPWPGSKAVDSVIRALVEKGDPKQPWYLLATVLSMTALVIVNTDGGFGWIPDGSELPLFGLAAYGAAIAWSPFAIGGAYLMGFRTCVGFLAAAVALLVMAPHLPDPSAPHRYVWPGIGFLVASGLTLLAINWRVVTGSLRALVSSSARQDDDPVLSPRAFAALAVVAIGLTLVYGAFALSLNLVVLLLLIVVGGGLQNLIATRAAAQTAFNPARVMGILLQGVVAAAGAPAASSNLIGAGMVAGSGAQAGNLTGDLVYGRWLRVPSRWQFWAQALTVIPCAAVAASVYGWIQQTRPPSLEGGTLPAPVAKMWAASALIFDGTTAMPAGATTALLIAAAVGVVYVLVEELTPLGRWLPSSVGLGIGLVLPIAYDLSFFLGGVLLWLVLGRALKVRDLTLTTIAVGCIVGEGIGGVAKPVLSILGVLAG